MRKQTDRHRVDEDDVEGHLRMTEEQLEAGTTPKEALKAAAAGSDQPS